MPNSVIILLVTVLVLIGTIGSIISYQIKKRKTFNDLITKKLRKHNLILVQNKFPGIFKVGPFKSDQIKVEIGKPLINNGTIKYNRTYFRQLELKNQNGKTFECWAKIDTHWFKDTQIQFRPMLSKI
jgi:hypothetical protein|tara:strand:+ start:152 stop:532 length:381 start_codon:yes stop_codon:yes gene_type:complete